MTADTIDHNTLVRLVEAHAVRGACVVGQPGGWGVIVQYGTVEQPLAATRSRGVRVFKKLDTLVGLSEGDGHPPLRGGRGGFRSADRDYLHPAGRFGSAQTRACGGRA